jgi:hypothetical protein
MLQSVEPTQQSDAVLGAISVQNAELWQQEFLTVVISVTHTCDLARA